MSRTVGLGTIGRDGRFACEFMVRDDDILFDTPGTLTKLVIRP